MFRIRERFDIIHKLGEAPPSWSVGETIGTHLRKIIEGVAFGCVIATEHSTNVVPRQAAGHWNAEQIFLALKKTGDFSYPDPNLIRPSTQDEKAAHNVSVTIEGVEEHRVPVDDLRAMYRRTHPWTHEDNPYVVRPIDDKNSSILLQDVARVEQMLRLHRIGICGANFLCTIRDRHDGDVKVKSIDKVGEL